MNVLADLEIGFWVTIPQKLYMLMYELISNWFFFDCNSRYVCIVPKEQRLTE